MSVQLIDNAKSYDWQTWLIGIMRSFLSGGAAALGTGTAGTIAGLTAKQQWIVMGTSFVSMGLYRMGEFLALHGAPDQVSKSLDTAAAANVQAGEAISKAQAQVGEANAKPPSN